MLKPYVLLTLIFTLGVKAYSEDVPEADAPAKFSPEISWYQPETQPTKRKRVQQVTLYGQTEEGVRVRFGKRALWIRTNKKGQKNITKIPIKKLRIKGKKIIDLDKDGSFERNLKMPVGEVQLPIYLVKGRERVKFQVAFQVKEKEVKIQTPEGSKVRECMKCIWFGAGVNYLAYSQDPPQDIDKVEFGAFDMPTITLRGNYKFNKDWGIRAAYHSLPGPDLTSPNINITNSTIVWTHFGLEADYRLLKPFRLFGFRFDPAVLVGLQSHDMPFLTQIDQDNFSVESFKFNSLSGGGMFLVNSDRKLYYEIYMRLQLALAGSGDLTLDSGFAFDGSIGAVYRWKPNWQIGWFWGGQYHTYSYSLEGESGAYTLLSSKMDVSLGYSF